ncbi:hypothetical protein [Kolteria novifilia]|uniref:hypothetical protein n=1 Tax=Kolteria novifilia TaxID=2527975 RepID=UPI003AF358F4
MRTVHDNGVEADDPPALVEAARPSGRVATCSTPLPFDVASDAGCSLRDVVVDEPRPAGPDWNNGPLTNQARFFAEASLEDSLEGFDGTGFPLVLAVAVAEVAGVVVLLGAACG